MATTMSCNGNATVMRYLDASIAAEETRRAELEITVGRLKARRDAINQNLRDLHQEIFLALQLGGTVSEVISAMEGDRFLCKVGGEGKYICDVDKKKVDPADIKPGNRVSVGVDNYKIMTKLPDTCDPLVSMMKVEKVPDSTYDMVGGLSEQVASVREVIELPIKHPELFESLGIAQPKGVLLYGPPGTGKTLLARAVAHHTNCTFVRVSGSELVQKYIGEGSRMVREIFNMAKDHAPSIIFMDEVDSIGSQRGGNGGSGGGDSEVQRTMMELLNQLDGFDNFLNIKIIMATNRIDILDTALLRPGRIDRKIEFANPSQASILEILSIHSKKMNLDKDINVQTIAKSLTGASGAETKGVCVEAGMFAIREKRRYVTQEDFEMAVAKVMNKNANESIAMMQIFK